MSSRRDDDPAAAASPGLAPQAPPGPPQSVEHVRADVLAALPDDVKALVVGPAQDLITAAQKAGNSDHSLVLARGLLRRVIRGLYLCEVRRSGEAHEGVDFDPTTGRALL